jgi:hypothetical protein
MEKQKRQLFVKQAYEPSSSLKKTLRHLRNLNEKAEFIKKVSQRFYITGS